MKDQFRLILVVIMFASIPWAFGFTVVADSVIPGDFEPDNDVDWADFAVLSAAWQTHSSEVGGNLAGYWKMDDDANNMTVLDSSENGNHGTAQQNTEDLSVTGIINGTLSFNGIDDYIQVADSEPLSPTQEVTVCGWFWFNDASENVGLIWKHNYNYALWTTSDTVRFAIWNSSSEGSTATFSTSLLESGWNFIAGVFDGTNSALYLNGAEAGNPGASITGPIRDRAGDLYIGQRSDGIGAQYFDGKIDDVRILDKALSGPEIEALYNQ